MNTEALENYCKPIYEKAPSLIHRWGHIKRAAVGAKWFVKILGGTKEEEELAYVAGLLHDIVRPNTEKIDHAIASAEEAEKILKKFDFAEDKIPLIVQSVRDHRKKPAQWDSILHQSVFLSDKILEQMGAYIVFRRVAYAGEIEDYKGMTAEEAIPIRWEGALKKTKKIFFSENLYKIYEYQNKWQIDFIEEFKKKEEWALNLGKELFKQGREGNKTLEQAIEEFSPVTEKGKEFKKETVEYLQGEKFIEFEKMILGGN